MCLLFFFFFHFWFLNIFLYFHFAERCVLLTWWCVWVLHVNLGFSSGWHAAVSRQFLLRARRRLHPRLARPAQLAAARQQAEEAQTGRPAETRPLWGEAPPPRPQVPPVWLVLVLSASIYPPLRDRSLWPVFFTSWRTPRWRRECWESGSVGAEHVWAGHASDRRSGFTCCSRVESKRLSFILAAKLRFSCVGISNKLFSHLILGDGDDGEAVAETCALQPVCKHSVVRRPHKWLRWNLYAELILFWLNRSSENKVSFKSAKFSKTLLEIQCVFKVSPEGGAHLNVHQCCCYKLFFSFFKASLLLFIHPEAQSRLHH